MTYQDALLLLLLVEKSDVAVHVGDVLMVETFDVLVHHGDLLEIGVLAVPIDWIVHEDAIHLVVLVGGDDVILQFPTIDLAELILKATEAQASLISVCSSFLEHWRTVLDVHLSTHVFLVQLAYMRAAGSELARKPTSSGERPSFD